MKFFVTVTPPGQSPITISREVSTRHKLQSDLAKEFGQGVSFMVSEYSKPRERQPITDADFEAEGRRIALESMDLPDGAYFAMADELGLDPY